MAEQSEMVATSAPSSHLSCCSTQSSPGGRLEMGKIETQARFFFFFPCKAAGKGLENCSLEGDLMIGCQYYRVSASTSEPHLRL